MQIEVSTRISKQLYRDFFWFNLSKARHFRVIIPLNLAFISLLTVSVFLLSAAAADTSALLMAFLVLMMLVLLFFIYIIQPMLLFNRLYDRLTMAQQYVFRDDVFEVRSEEPISKGQSENRYEVLYKAFETDDYFFLYIGPAVAYLLRKADFAPGAPEELRAKLREKLGRKFKEKHG
jgi:ABC-type multidrug transport system fused ATPase/permease subunit